jgi:hypothetical protein
MIPRVLQTGMRVLYVLIAAVGLWIAVGGYPPPASGPPVQLAIGAVIGVIGLAGTIWPEKIRSGSSGPD